MVLQNAIGNLALVAINGKELRREAGRPAFYI
jgi:hypothetical protein